jgi:hypothetical protein
MSIGEDRVRIKFNPSASNLVDDIKQRTAALIDMCEERKEARAQPAPLTAAQSEVNRLWSLAQTHYEDAAMWAVKAATSEK